MESLDYVSGPEHPPSPDYVPDPEEPEQASLSPNLSSDASPATLSPGYIDDFDPEEDPKEDPEVDPVDYWISDDELEAPDAAPQSSGHAPPSPHYVPGPEHPPSPNYVLSPEEPEQAPLSPDYVPEPEYPEYLAPSDAEANMEDQPLPDDASPTALPPGYVADSGPEEDPKEDPADYPADGGDDDDDVSFDDTDDDHDEDEQEASKDDDEEEEHPALADSLVVHVDDYVPSAEDIEEFETDESAPTPIPSPRRRTARMSIRTQTLMLATIEVLIAKYASAPTPPSPLSPLSSPLPQIPSPPLLLPSPPTTIPTYAEVPLGYRAAGIRLRAALPSTHHPSEIPSPPLLLPSTTHKDDLPEADMPLQKRARFTTPIGRH
ncbi:hypothetical protein Tco_1087477 [Tanacetum coccineum]